MMSADEREGRPEIYTGLNSVQASKTLQIHSMLVAVVGRLRAARSSIV
jgi:hypothetical protein